MHRFRKLFWDALLIVFWITFCSPLDPFYPSLAPFWLPSAPYCQPLAHFLLPMGTFSVPLCSSRLLSVRSRVVMGIFGSRLDQAVFKWLPKCSQNRFIGSEFQLQIGYHFPVGVSCKVLADDFSCARRCRKRNNYFH